MSQKMYLQAIAVWIVILATIGVVFWLGFQFGVDVQKQMAFDGLRGVVFNDTAAKHCTMHVENMTAYINCTASP